MRLTKSLQAIAPIASAYDLHFIGTTNKGHYRWKHRPTGRTMVTVRSLTSRHALKNTERQIKRFLRELSNGQHANEN